MSHPSLDIDGPPSALASAPTDPPLDPASDRPPDDGTSATSADQSGIVGRARELAVIQARLTDAAAGRGGLTALGGEAGIGKTRLAHAAADLARAAGAAVLWGHCYEGEWAPPYGPWVEALADHARDVAPEHLRAELAALGPGAAPLAALLPALRAVLPNLAGLDASVSGDLPPAEARFRLHDAVAALLLAAARDRPLLLVLDDLHWADQPSLDLLRHLARLLDRSRLLALVAYRDAGLDRDHPLTAALAALRREPGFQSLLLKGLGRAAVTALLARAVRREVSPDLGRLIHGETGGNPFYVEEVMRHLVDEGGLVERAGRWTADRGIRELGVPEGVRQVVARHLTRVSDQTRRLLDDAAVFTAGVDVPTLLVLTGLPEDDLLDALDEALAAGLLRPVDGRPDTYDFAHAIVRHALADERNPSRTLRLHRRAADALARVHGDAPDPAHAAELALQYHASASLPGAAAGVPHALAAAAHARAAFARDRAVVFLRVARDLTAGLAPRDRANVLTRLAVAEADALLLDDARATAQQALADLEASGTPGEEVAAFLATLVFALKSGHAETPVWRPLVDQALALVGDDRGLTWARLMLLLDPVAPLPGDLRAGRWLGFDPEAVAIARSLGDEEDHARTLESFDVRSLPETRALVALARGWTRPTAVLRALTVAANDLQYRHGAFADALDLWREMHDEAERIGAISWQAQALDQQTFVLVALGDFAAARDAEARAADLLARLGSASRADAIRAEMAAAFALALDDGDWRGIATVLTREVTGPPPGPGDLDALTGVLYAAIAALAHARAGAPTLAHRLLAALTPALAHADPTRGNQNHNGTIAFAGEALWTLAGRGEGSNGTNGKTVSANGAVRPADAALAARHRAWARDLLAAGLGDYPQTSLALTAARAATLLGDDADADTHFALARETLGASGQRPLRAIVDHDEALALLRPGRAADPARAAYLLEAARAAFADLGMHGWTQRAQTALDALAARPAAGRAPYPAGITEREADVLRLVARGHSDRQIGDVLFLSPRTVNAHVRNMLTKTDRANRTELSVWGVEHGIVTRVPDP